MGRRIRRRLRVRGCCPRPRLARRRDPWFAISVLWLRLCQLPAGRCSFLGLLREQVQIVQSGERDLPRLRRLAASLPVSSPNGLSVTNRSSATGSPPPHDVLRIKSSANSSLRCPLG